MAEDVGEALEGGSLEETRGDGVVEVLDGDVGRGEDPFAFPCLVFRAVLEYLIPRHLDRVRSKGLLCSYGVHRERGRRGEVCRSRREEEVETV